MEIEMHPGWQSCIMSNYAELHHFENSLVQDTSSSADSTGTKTKLADSSTESQSSQSVAPTKCPYGAERKPADMSDDEWYKKLEDDFQRIKPKALELVKKYKDMGVADVFSREAATHYSSFEAQHMPADINDRWEIDNMDAALSKKVEYEGYVLTDDERECFKFAAATEWLCNNDKSSMAARTQASHLKSQDELKGSLLDTNG